MELSELLNQKLFGSDSLNTLSETAGADRDKVSQALRDALPVLVRSMQKNASTESGKAALAKALDDHAGDDTGDVSRFIKNADLKDGSKILGHILGDNEKTLESAVSTRAGLSPAQTSALLSAAAPLLLNILGQKKKDDDEKEPGGLLGILASAFLGGGGQNGGALAGGLGSLFGGGNDDDQGGGNLGALAGGLGSLLGGGKDDDQGGGNLGSLLGSMFGGGEEEKPVVIKPAGRKTAVRKTAPKKPPAKKPGTVNR